MSAPYEHLTRLGPAGAVNPEGVPPRFQRTLPAQLSAAGQIRREFAAWLRRLGWPERARNDVILAVSEAVSYAAEYASAPGRAGDIEVQAAVMAGAEQTRRIVVTVVDHGRWRQASTDGRSRRLGLRIMRAVADELRLDAAPDATRSRSARPPRALEPVPYPR